MTNHQIREAIKEIIRIKALKEREQELREKIFKELHKRRKEKLNLGGEDFVKVREVTVNDYSSFDLLLKLYPWIAEDKKISTELKGFCALVSIAKGLVREKLGQNFFDRLIPIGDRSHKQLSYKISLDKKNQVRGIDL